MIKCRSLEAIQTIRLWGQFTLLHLSQRKSGQILVLNLHSYHTLNPGFRIYDVDFETNQIIDFNQYRLDLQKWNQYAGPIEWDLAYSIINVRKVTYQFVEKSVGIQLNRFYIHVS